MSGIRRNTLCNPTSTRRSDPRIDCVKWTTGYCRVGNQALHRKYATGPKPKATVLKLCTWNVRGLNTPGKLQALEHTLERIAITGVAETHWRTTGHFQTSCGNMVISSSNQHESRNGVAMIINKSLKDCILGYQTVNDRIMMVRLQAKPVNLNIIQVYAPTSSSSPEDAETFYNLLSSTIQQVPRREMLLVMGDFNAKIGSTYNDDHLRTVVGNFGTGERNERGEMLLDFCTENELFVANSNFQHHVRRLYTWQSPNGHTRNQIDYVLVQQRWKSSVRDAKTYPGLDCGSDHNALVAEVSLKLKKVLKNKPKDNRWHLIKEDKYKEELSEAIKQLPQSRMNELTANELWMEFRDLLETPAKKYHSQNLTKKPWIATETMELINKRQAIKCKGMQHNLETYNELTKNINRALRLDKKHFIETICKEIENHRVDNEPRDLFKKVKYLSQSLQPRYLPVKDKSGKTLTDTDAILDRWREYCTELMAENSNITQSSYKCNDLSEPDILLGEVEIAIKRLSNNKAVGADGIVAEMVKAAGEDGARVMHHICNKVWSTGIWPRDWIKSIYVPLYKKGDRENCSNYRTIALICHASKVLLHIIHERLKPYLLPQIPQEQAGFIPGKGTRDQLINVRQMIEKMYEFNVPAIFCFLDYSKAFDTVNWNTLWKVLSEMGVPNHLTHLIEQLYLHNEAFVCVDGRLSKQFSVEKGVRQGCILSPILFNIYGEWIIRKATEDWDGGVSVGGRKISNLRYADDTTLLASTEDEMENLLRRVENFSGEAGLKLNRNKCSMLVVDRMGILPPVFTSIPDIARKESIIYLGASITNKGGSESEVKRRIGMAKTALNKLVKVWKDHNISKNTKQRLMKSLVFSIATYGSESWTINAACKRRLEAFEMICYRKMLRIPWTARRTNASILQELKIAENDRLVPGIQRSILKYFGHVIRKDGLEKQVLQGKVDGRRRRGRSPNRYMDQIKAWTNLSIDGVMRTTEDREAWRNLTIPTANHLGHDV